MAALESGRIKLETAPFNFRAFMSKTVTPFVRRAEEKGLRMRVTISKTKPARVRCDEAVVAKPSQQCDQVYQTGEVAVEVDPGSILGCHSRVCKASDTTLSRGNAFYLFFAVRDTGIGIPREKQEVIFTKISKARSPCLTGENRRVRG